MIKIIFSLVIFFILIVFLILFFIAFNNKYINNIEKFTEQELKKYPPKRYNSVSNEFRATLTNRYVKSATFVLNQNDITYGSGEYQIYFSDDAFIGIYGPNVLFNNDFRDDTVGCQYNPNYAINTGFYTGSNNNYIVSNYLGSWIVIKLPVAIILKKYIFYARQNVDLYSRAPGEWKVYGSNNGIDFTEIDFATANINNYKNTLKHERIFNSMFPYLYYGFTINKLVGGNQYSTQFNIMELELYGVEEILDIPVLTNCIANVNSSGLIKQIPYTDDAITNISAINKINDYIFNQSFNNAGITYTITFSRYLDNDYSPINLLSRNNKLTVFYDSINRDNYDRNGNYIGIFSRNTNIVPNLNNYNQKGDFIHIRLTSSSSSSSSSSNFPINLKRYGFIADEQRVSKAPGTWALYAGTRLLEPSTKNATLLVNNTNRLNSNSYCSANLFTYIHDINSNETSANELLFIFTSLTESSNNNNEKVLSFMKLLLFTS